MKKILAVVLIAVFLCGASGCKGDLPEEASSDPGNSVPIDSRNLSDITAAMQEAGLANLDVFGQWVRDYESAGGEAPETGGFSDADCRMTVMLLCGDGFSYENLETSYGGDYLMFDLDAIENDESFAVLRDKKDLFVTLFGEMGPVGADGRGVFEENWTRHGLRYDNEKAAVISLLMPTYENDRLFVGHTGVLIDCTGSAGVYQGKLLFIEKLAFEEAFMATVLEDEKELLDLFAGRPDYTVEEDEMRPLVYKNGDRIGEL